MFAGERVRRRAPSMPADEARCPPGRTAVGIGSAQILALLPGISRSGSTMVAGLLANLTHEALPLCIPARDAHHLGRRRLENPGPLHPRRLAISRSYLAGGLTAGVAAFLSVRLPNAILRVGRLDPFGPTTARRSARILILLSR